MRCIAIAKELNKRNIEATFVVSDNNSVPILSSYGFKYIVLNVNWQDLSREKDIIENLLRDEHNPILFIDTYSITKEYVDLLKPYSKIVYLGSKKLYLGDINLLINYSADIDYSFYEQYQNTRLLLGPKYAPLREEFYGKNKEFNNSMKRVLITVGNSDPLQFELKLLSRLYESKHFADLSFDVVVGSLFDNKEEIFERFGEKKNIVLHSNVRGMSSLMESADFAISANGTTVYELSAMMVPTLSFSLVQEQINSANALKKLGIIDYCGEAFVNLEETINTIIEKLDYYYQNSAERKKLGERANELISGNGCQLIVDSIIRLL